MHPTEILETRRGRSAASLVKKRVPVTMLVANYAHDANKTVKQTARSMGVVAEGPILSQTLAAVSVALCQRAVVQARLPQALTGQGAAALRLQQGQLGGHLSPQGGPGSLGEVRGAASRGARRTCARGRARSSTCSGAEITRRAPARIHACSLLETSLCVDGFNDAPACKHSRGRP